MPNIINDIKLDFKDVLFLPKRGKAESRSDVSILFSGSESRKKNLLTNVLTGQGINQPLIFSLRLVDTAFTFIDLCK